MSGGTAPDATPVTAPDGGQPHGSPEPKAPRPGWIAIIVMAVVGLIGVLLILAAWELPPFASPVVATNDAYVQGRVTVMAAQVSGYVADVFVHDYQHVRRGTPLVRIDQRIYRQQVAQSQGQLDSARANYDNSVQQVATDRAQLAGDEANLMAVRAELLRAGLDNQRLQQLAQRGSVSRRESDQGLSTLRSAQANVAKAEATLRIDREKIKSDLVSREGLAAQIETARAALGLARINLANTIVYAPRDGQISDMQVRAGQYVSAGSQIVYFVPPELWVVANYKETQSEHIRPGQPASIAVDALGGRRLAGHVRVFAPATGSQFSVLKPDNATGNFTKIVQRVPIRIDIDRDQPLAARLRPGLSVTTRIDTVAARHPDRCWGPDPDAIGRLRDVGPRRADGSCEAPR